jgi:hypothetical protein
MNDLSDQEFHAWLDNLVPGGELPATLPQDDAADLALASRLLALREAPSPRLAAKIKQIVAAPSQTRSPVRVPGRRGARRAGVGMMAALLLIFFLAFTPAGTWAQGMLQRFGITFLPGVMPQWSQGLPEITPTRSPIAFSSESEIQAAAEFPLQWPTEFPFDRGGVSFLGFMAYTQDGAWIESLYGDEVHRYLEIQVFWGRRPGPWPVGDARLETISVAGRDGLWGQGVPASFIAGARSALIHEYVDGRVTRVGSAEGASLEPINILLWEDGEILYMLVDPNQQFSLPELLRTAESAYKDR